jgi:hypothetical protein
MTATPATVCPACNVKLVIPGGLVAPTLTCPRCLAQLPNPLATATDVVAAEKVDRCFRCGTSTQPEWNYCPSCMSPLCVQAPRPTFVTDAGTDVRRDGHGALAGLAILIVLSVIGAGGLMLAGGVDLVQSSEQGAAIVWTAAAFLVLVLGGTTAMVLLPTTPQAKSTSLVLGTVGVVLTPVVAALIGALALFIAVWQECCAP